MQPFAQEWYPAQQLSLNFADQYFTTTKKVGCHSQPTFITACHLRKHVVLYVYVICLCDPRYMHLQDA